MKSLNLILVALLSLPLAAFTQVAIAQEHEVQKTTKLSSELRLLILTAAKNNRKQTEDETYRYLRNTFPDVRSEFLSQIAKQVHKKNEHSRSIYRQK